MLARQPKSASWIAGIAATRMPPAGCPNSIGAQSLVSHNRMRFAPVERNRSHNHAHILQRRTCRTTPKSTSPATEPFRECAFAKRKPTMNYPISPRDFLRFTVRSETLHELRYPKFKLSQSTGLSSNCVGRNRYWRGRIRGPKPISSPAQKVLLHSYNRADSIACFENLSSPSTSSRNY